MNFIFLSPHFPPTFYQFIMALNKRGVNVLGLADEPFENLQPELADALTHYYRVQDMNDYEQMLRACGFFIHEYGRIDRIDSLNEHWLELEAQLRTDFNIVGPKIYGLEKMRRKSQMKQMFVNAGVPVAQGRTVHTLADGEAFVNRVGYPVVAKPDAGVGASDTYKITNRDDLLYFFEHKPSVDYFMEEFVEGVICTFDGLTNRQGEPVFFTSHQYSQGVMEAVNNDDHLYYYSYREIPKDLEEAGRRILTVFDVRERFFHFEFFRTANKRLIALEVNMRPPGGLTADMFNYANDISIYDEWANIVVSNEFRASYSRPYHCAHIGRKYHKDYLHTHDDIFAQYPLEIVHHQPMHPLFARAMGDYTFLVRTPNFDKLLEMAEFIQRLR